MILLRCKDCRRGFTALSDPAFRCLLCGCKQWVEVFNLTLSDRWRLWRQTGLPPWTKLEQLP